MPKKLQDYLLKIKKPNPKINFPTTINSFSSSKDWILSGCKNPKTLSFAVGRTDQKHDNHAGDISAKLSDIDRFLFENFKSLYIKDDAVEPADNIQENSVGVLFESPRLTDPVPKLCGSNRFFVSPGVSSSLIEESRTSMATTNSDDVVCSSSSTSTADHDQNAVVSLPDDCVAVLAYSPSPYEEFRSSMQEMVEARLRRGENVDWGFVEELLFCYLSLNDKKLHKHILGAFVDLVVDLRRRDSEHGTSTMERSRHCRRRKLKRENCNVRNWS